MTRLPLHRWRYSTRILFSGCDQATYQQDLVIHRTAGRDHEEEAGGLRIWHIYLGPKCRPDYGDLRFTDGDARELAYYLWPDYTPESARVSVRLEGADQSGALTVYYGNPSAETTSDAGSLLRPVEGSILYLPLDEGSGSTTADISGNNNNGTLVGGPTWVDGPFKKALKFTGSNQVTIPHSTALERYRSDFTISAWIKLDAYPSEWVGAIVSNRNAGGTAGSLFFVRGELDPTYRRRIAFDTCIGTTGRMIYGATPLSLGQLYHVAITFKYVGGNSNPATIYLNGVPDATATINDIASSAEGTVIAYEPASPPASYHLRGTVDEVAIYSRALTPSEILGIASSYSATPPSLLRTSRGVNPSYVGLARLTGSAAADDGVIQFAGVGSILVVGEERETIAGAGSFAIETSARSPIPIAGAAEVATSLRLVPTPATITGAGDATSPLTCLTTPLDIETGEGSAYVAPTPVQFDLTKYRFSSLTISRSAQDALWRCEGRIVGLDAPLAYKQFEVRVPDHNGVLRTLFVGFVPGRDYVRAVTADESIIQGYDAGFYLTRQYLPDGNLTYPRVFGWGPARLLHYFLGEEGVNVYSRSRWEQITGIMPYRLENPPSYYEWPYSSRIDWVFQPKTTKAQAIQEICEKSGLVFLVKWRKINGAWTPCAYLVPEEDIDHPTRGLDLPDPVTFTHPDPHVMNYVRVTMRSDEKYNRIEVRSASPSGAWFHAVRETPALQAGEELPIEYLEERSDLPIDADHGGWCNARADELYAYYTKYAYTYTLTLINRVDLELYQRCRFYGFDAIPSGEMMRIIAITYNVLPTHTEVEITVTPDSRLSDLRKLQRSQAADSVSEVQTIAQSQIDRLAAGEVGTVIGIDGAEAIVELERKADSSVRGRIV